MSLDNDYTVGEHNEYSVTLDYTDGMIGIEDNHNPGIWLTPDDARKMADLLTHLADRADARKMQLPTVADVAGIWADK